MIAVPAYNCLFVSYLVHDVVRDLGVLLDSEMTMQRPISKVTYHLRRLPQIRNYVSQSVMAQLVTSLVITCINYCNSILSGLPACRLVPLQRVQTRLLDWC